MQHISEVVFVVMCQRVGTSEEIVLRREAMDIKEVVDRRVTAKDGLFHMLSGSMREGFRLEGSDVDMMYWQNNHRVIMDMSQSEFYNKANTTLILSDSSESPPGFTLLQLLTPTTDSDVQSACVIMNDKEVINQQSDETSKLLCSYHMKTAIFWAIQQNIQPHWCVQNFLAGFWVCFKLLLKWVYEGICPNFFIPQNNMFLTKVHGSAQNRLFIELYQLYNKGMTCLLESYSIEPWINYTLYNPILRSSIINTDESTYISDSEYDAELVIESMPYFNTNILPRDLCQITKVINTIEQLIESPLSHYQVVVLQKLTSYILYSTAFLLQNMYTYSSVNKQMYIADKQSYHMLKLAAKFGYVSDTLYIAMR
uniref:Mab-21-like HhH/H2TH-like domain-containing protein n=1 Tax=Magallana gigas TaxID=29159 RepID=K1QL61_MAGGI